MEKEAMEAAVVGSVEAAMEMVADMAEAVDSRANRQEHSEGSSGTAEAARASARMEGAEEMAVEGAAIEAGFGEAATVEVETAKVVEAMAVMEAVAAGQAVAAEMAAP